MSHFIHVIHHGVFHCPESGEVWCRKDDEEKVIVRRENVMGKLMLSAEGYEWFCFEMSYAEFLLNYRPVNRLSAKLPYVSLETDVHLVSTEKA